MAVFHPHSYQPVQSRERVVYAPFMAPRPPESLVGVRRYTQPTIIASEAKPAQQGVVSKRASTPDFRGGTCQPKASPEAPVRPADISSTPAAMRRKHLPAVAVLKSDDVALVSLGSTCAVKLTFDRMKRRQATLPFDWVRTRLSGVLHFLRNDFQGFFDTVTSAEVPGELNGLGTRTPTGKTMHRGYLHSFWNDGDDITKPEVREKYERRFARFQAIRAQESPVLFVRATVSTDEVEEVMELVEELKMRFGPKAHLLLIVDWQNADYSAFVEGCDNLLVSSCRISLKMYRECLETGLRWAAGEDLSNLRTFPSLKALSEELVETHHGLNGLGGLSSFEPEPPGTVN